MHIYRERENAREINKTYVCMCTQVVQWVRQGTVCMSSISLCV